MVFKKNIPIADTILAKLGR